MQYKFILTLLSTIMITLQSSATQREIPHSCNADGERFYCVDEHQQPLNGKIYETWENGKYKSIINYKKGYADGLATYFNDEGKLMERVYYKQGIKNGMDKIYYDNRTIKVWAQYNNGELDGWQNFYTDEGKQQGKAYYKRGKLTGGYCLADLPNRRQKVNISREQIEKNGFNQLFQCEAK
ncbi:MAG: hypothetical protein IJ099_05375 [Alphaproteobacteria bacterium]|nr:hypothetical protein [Alphaproteobacteria bacterium]